MASLKMMRYSNVLRLVLSVGAKLSQRIDMSLVEWLGKLLILTKQKLHQSDAITQCDLRKCVAT